jgi:aminocarboxymuconate-semialdehyde decarboxylase
MFKEKENTDFGLKKPVPEYFKMFYADSALHGNIPGMMSGYDFFGPERIMFGTDMPFGSEEGMWAIKETVDSIEQMPIPDTEKQMIFEDNAKKLLRIT